MSNQGIDVDALLGHWVPYVVGQRDSITVAMDWTEFDADGQATIMLSLLSRHGRATPLVWLTVDKATLKNRRNGYEYQVLVRLAEILPADVRVRIVADRGFGDHKLYRVLSEELKFDFVIRFRGNSRSPPPMARRGPRPIGLAPAVRANPARCCGHRPGVSGRHRGLRAGEGHERAVVPGRQHRRRTRAGLDQPVCQALGDRGRFPRHKRYPLRHGARIDACQHAGPRDRLWLINAFEWSC